ncbi:hypothetical protein PanWU01x14_184830 [Parasponia andersonii]|uniref:Uncharacterized protein n=1 Tax=Parasponia andersonii TaxID=3476 RepID=A0A2P5C4G7_PARAD|nr:hypothetical protein PanWU01x14_184830 [Parasponia andersonii]
MAFSPPSTFLTSLWIFASSVSKPSQRLSRSSTHLPNVPKLDSSRDTLVFKLVITSLDLPWVAPFLLYHAQI